MSEWQDISTAPKDGSDFCVYDDIAGFVPWVYWSGGSFTSRYFRWSGRFKHWMPIPPPPAQEGE